MSRTCMLLAVGACLGVAGGGCGDDAATSGTLSQYCASFCAWHTTCSPPADSTCAATCKTRSAQGRPSFFAAAASCYDKLDCSKSDDACASVGLQAASDAQSTQIQADCLAKRDSCKSTVSIADDYCYSVAGLVDSARAASSACLGKDCAEVEACLQAAGAP